MRTILYQEEMPGILTSHVIRNYEYTMQYQHTHPAYEIYYLINGERNYFIENRIYHVLPGSLVFINSNVIHKTSQCGSSCHERIVVELQEEPTASLLRCTGELSLSDFFARNQGVLWLPKKSRSRAADLLKEMADEIHHQEPGYQLLAAGKLAQLLIFAERHLSGHQRSEGEFLATSAAHQRITEIASYISQNSAQAGSLSEIAQRFYMNKSYLSRVFKEATGYTVNEYINVNRIRNAKKLLSETGLSITEISAESGYDSITYFERIFQKYTKTSPRQYRKQFRAEQS